MMAPIIVISAQRSSLSDYAEMETSKFFISGASSFFYKVRQMLLYPLARGFRAVIPIRKNSTGLIISKKLFIQ